MHNPRSVLNRSLSLLALAALACSHEQRAPTPQASAAPSSTQALQASRSASASAATPATASAAALPTAHCKAFSKSGTLTLTSLKESEVQLASQGDTLFALAYSFELARTRLYRFSRAGGPVEPIAEQKGIIGDRTHFALLDGAAYYTQAGKLLKLGPDKGTALKLYDGVHSPAVVSGSHVFVIACDSKGSDHLLQIPLEGGAAETLAELPRASHDSCRYASLVADERHVFIADWNGSRVLAVSRDDKSVTSIVTKQGFPATLGLDSTGLWFTSALGVFHVDRQGGSRTQLAKDDLALAPYALTVTNGDEHWVFDNMPYSTSCNLYRLSIGDVDARPKPFMQIYDANPNGSTPDGFGLLDFSVDDECVYVAQTQNQKLGTQILVKHK